TVKAVYDGLDTFYDTVTSDEDTFNVIKIPTTTNISLANRTVGNVTINVTVTDKDDNPVTTGLVDVTYTIDNGVSTTKTIELNDNITPVKIDIDNADVLFSVRAKYLGTDKYESSQTEQPGIGSTTIKQNATLTIEEEPSPVYVYEDVTYSGTLLDGMGEPIKDATIRIIVMSGTNEIDRNETVKTDEDGHYSWTRTSIAVGQLLNVTAYYDGNKVVNAVNNSTEYTVNKRPTTTIVNVVNDTVGFTSIDVVVEDALENNVILKEGTLTITVGTDEFTKNIDTSGTTHIDIPTT
ncbi:MAG: hypothetical protein BZ136_02320, partial [Methanosphaera sp. rholeuAM74]